MTSELYAVHSEEVVYMIDVSERIFSSFLAIDDSLFHNWGELVWLS